MSLSLRRIELLFSTLVVFVPLINDLFEADVAEIPLVLLFAEKLRLSVARNFLSFAAGNARIDSLLRTVVADSADAASFFEVEKSVLAGRLLENGGYAYIKEHGLLL